MLRQAQPKAPDIAWVQADGAGLPFQSQSFDFVTCQYALHHIQDKAGMLQGVFRVLRCGGRVVLRNLCPQECADWLYYAYFPEAYTIDLADFWPPEAVVAVLEATGFVAVTVERQHLRYEQNVRLWLDTVRRRDTCSQLLAIPDAAYAAGVRRMEHELAARNAPLVRAIISVLSLFGARSRQALPDGRADIPGGLGRATPGPSPLLVELVRARHSQ